MVLRKALWPNDSRSGVVHGRVCDLGPVEKAQALTALWRIEIVRAKLELLGTIEAADLAEAVVKTMAEFNIPEERRNRLIVQKIGKVKD